MDINNDVMLAVAFRAVSMYNEQITKIRIGKDKRPADQDE